MRITLMGYCCFGWFCLSFGALAMSEEHRFEPSQLEKIRNVGQGLLGAKRSYQQNPEIQNLKDEIEDIRKQIDSLIKSYDSDVSTDSTGLSKSSKKSIVPVASLDREELWRKKHAAKIDALVQATGNLSQQMQATQKLQLKVNPKQKQSNNIEPKFGSISTAVVPTLANLHAEISSAIALPQEEQKKELKRLSDQLTFSHGPFKVKALNPSTPTMITRTSHRHDASNSSGAQP